MSDNAMITVNVPTQIGKIGSPGKCCWVKIIGTPSVAESQKLGVGDVTSFCVHGNNTYTWGGGSLYCNKVNLGIAAPSSPPFKMRVLGAKIYIWCEDLSLYTLQLDPLANALTQVDWDTTSFLAHPVDMALDGQGWFLTRDGNGNQCLTRWAIVQNKLTNVTQINGVDIDSITAITTIAGTLYVADLLNIYRVTQVGSDYAANSVLDIPADWDGIAGMLGQSATYNDPDPDGASNFSRYLYVVSKQNGAICLVYPDFSVQPTVTTASASDGSTVFGNLQLGDNGLLYYLQSSATGGISTLNVLNGQPLYVDQSGEAHNGNTLLPNRLMGFHPQASLSLVWYDMDCKTKGVGAPLNQVDIHCTDQAKIYLEGGRIYEYNRSFFEDLGGKQVEIDLQNPHALEQGPALLLQCAQVDGNIIVGDIYVDPHMHFSPDHSPLK